MATATRPGFRERPLGDADGSAPGPVAGTDPRALRAEGDRSSGTPVPGLPRLRAGSATPEARRRPAALRLPALAAIAVHVALLTALTFLRPDDAAPPRRSPGFMALRMAPALPPPEPEPKVPELLPPTEVATLAPEPSVEDLPLPPEEPPPRASRPAEAAPVLHAEGPPAFDGPPAGFDTPRNRVTSPAASVPATTVATAAAVTGPSRGVAFLEGGCPDPTYPPRARERGFEGVTLLRFHVNAEGTVDAVEIDSSSGHDLLDRAARDAALLWRFQPALENGTPVPSWARREVRFILR